MFKFLKDIKELKRDVKEIFEEFNEDYVSTGWFSFNKRRTLSKKVDDLEEVVDKLLGHLKLEAIQSKTIPEQTIPEVPAKWSIAPKGTHAKKIAAAEKVVTTKTKKGKK